jgi:hypothetical protein
LALAKVWEWQAKPNAFSLAALVEEIVKPQVRAIVVQRIAKVSGESDAQQSFERRLLSIRRALGHDAFRLHRILSF